MHLLAVGLASLALTPGCASEGQTFVANRDVRVYFLRDTLDGVRRMYACDLVSGRRRKISDDIYEDGVRLPLALAGRHVAFEDAFCDDKAGTCFGDVLRYDAARDRFEVLYRWEHLRLASKVVVTPGGAVAWLRGGEVRTADRVLATGASSLGVVGRRVYWMRGGRPGSTLLGPPAPRRGRPPRSIRSRDCAVRGQTVAANQDFRIFRVNRPVVASRIYYACDLRRHRARFIDRLDDEHGLQRLVLSGRYVAFEYQVCDDPESGGCAHSMWRLDARRRRPTFLRALPADAPAATDLAVTRTGAVAWIVRGEVAASDATGWHRLDQGGGALAVAGRRIYWMSGGKARSARLD